MRHIYNILNSAAACCIILLGSLLAGCRGEKPFKVSIEYADKSNTDPLYVKYYGKGAMVAVEPKYTDHVFITEGLAPDLSLLRVYDSRGNVIGEAAVTAGDDIHMRIDTSNPCNNTMEGSALNEQWAQLVTANAQLLNSGDARKINDFVAEYVRSHPSDVLSALLLVTRYDASLQPSQAAALMESLAPEAQVPSIVADFVVNYRHFTDEASLLPVRDFDYRKYRGDTIYTFSPGKKKASVIAFSETRAQRSATGDSVVEHLRKMHNTFPKADFQILDIALFSDSSVWRHSTMPDSAAWEVALVPGGLLSSALYPLAVPRLPFYIVTDSAGTQVYRGPDPAAAQSAVKEIMEKHGKP